MVGRHCESGDQLVDGVAAARPAVGDLLAVPVTGAYCYTMSNQYNGARRVPVVFASDGKARLVVRRDTWDDLLIRDVTRTRGAQQYCDGQDCPMAEPRRRSSNWRVATASPPNTRTGPAATSTCRKPRWSPCSARSACPQPPRRTAPAALAAHDRELLEPRAAARPSSAAPDTESSFWVHVTHGDPVAPVDPAGGRQCPRRPASAGELHSPIRSRRPAGRRGHLRAARRPAAGLSPAARASRLVRGQHTADRHPGLAGAAAAARRQADLGPGHPALQRAVRKILGRRRFDRPDRPGGVVGARSTAPATSWSTRCTPPRRPRRWSRRRTCRPRGASSTRSTCASEAIPEFADVRQRGRIRKAARRAAQDAHAMPTLIDRDAAWEAKRAALESVYRVKRSAGRQLAYAAYREREGRSLDDFATWCALAEQHGADWHELARRRCATRRARRWPISPPSTPTRVDFHRWLQWQLDEQLAARAVDGRAGRAWRWASCTTSRSGCIRTAPTPGRCRTCSRSASPRAPRRTSSTSSGRTGRSRRGGPTSSPSRATSRSGRMVNAVLRHAGGVRVDHIIGLFRLWWIPKGAAADRGHLRALRPRGDDRHPRAGGAPRRARWSSARTSARSSRGCATTCASAGSSAPRSCGSSWTATATAARCTRERWREYCLSSVTTHDLPPTAGLPGRRARPAARRARPADPAGRRGAGRRPGRAGGLAGRAAAGRAAAATKPGVERDGRWRCTATSAAPRRGCWRCRWPTRSATGAPRTSRAPPTSTRTGGCRSAGPTGGRSCSRTCSPTRARPRWPRPCGPR